MTLTARLQAIRERVEYARECESPYSAPYSAEDMAFLLEALEKAVGALEYCSNYSNTKEGLSPYQFRGVEMAMRHAVQSFEEKSRKAVAEIEKLAGGEK